jgi:organic radical activating enzyme
MVEIIFHFLKVQIIMDIKPTIEKYKTQGHLQQNKNRLNIHWDTLTICQLECSYCYARNTYGREWNKLASKTVIDKVIDALSQSFLPFNLGLLGGEPTLGPHYNYIIDELKKLNKTNKIYVTTNGEKDLKTIRTDGVAFLFSYHPADCTSDENFLNNVKYIKENNIQCKVNIILHPAKKYWKKSKDMAKAVQNLNVKIHPHFLYGNWDRKLYGYKNDFWEYFKFFKDLERDIKYDDDSFNDFDVFEYNLTNFKGWSCFNNNFEIDVNANVVQFCREKDTMTSNLLRDNEYFKRITEVKPMICPHTQCNCDGLLKQLKVRND